MSSDPLDQLLAQLGAQAFSGLDASGHVAELGGIDSRFDLVLAPMVAASAGSLRVLHVNVGPGTVTAHLATMLRDRHDGSRIVCLDDELPAPKAWARFTLNMASLGCERVVVPLPLDALTGINLLAERQAVFDLIFVGGAREAGRLGQLLETGWSLLAPGGLLCGGDFAPGSPEVRQAVEHFVTTHVLQGSTDQTLWFVPKPSAAACAA